MCGFAGYFDKQSGSYKTNIENLIMMIQKIHSRGPDDDGTWIDRSIGIALGHKRLSILDVSKYGKQPMMSTSGRFVITFNGEIYNHLELRKEIKSLYHDYCWRGNSDTETLLASIETFGIKLAIEKCIGMFAIAIWDRKKKVLSLARDRMGEKPLYYGWNFNRGKKFFVFGSVLKSLIAHKDFTAEISKKALTGYVRYGYVPTPLSIFEGIYKLTPGSILSFSTKTQEYSIEQYWDFSSVAISGKRFAEKYTLDEKVRELDALLEKSVKGQMISDVPIGALLSGGIDSTTIVSLMQKNSTNPVKTFSIGFEESGFNEANYAKSIATHLGTDHNELFVGPSEALNMIYQVADAYDEPFSDSSQIPTLLVSQFASKEVKVVLTGDGADEIFGGYNRYIFSRKIWGKISFYPMPVKKLLANIIFLMTKENWSTVLKKIPGLHTRSDWGDYLHRGAEVISSENLFSLYKSLVSTWKNPSDILLAAEESENTITELQNKFVDLNEIEKLMAIDCVTYLLDDILVKVDRASMNFSLETRVPFLDHRVVEFAWKLPLKMKLGKQSKLILREILKDKVPQNLTDRPKMGFGMPIGDWLRGPLKDWSNDMLNLSRINNEGLFNGVTIQQTIKSHLSRERDYSAKLWNILMFETWKEKYC